MVAGPCPECGTPHWTGNCPRCHYRGEHRPDLILGAGCGGPAVPFPMSFTQVGGTVISDPPGFTISSVTLAKGDALVVFVNGIAPGGLTTDQLGSCSWGASSLTPNFPSGDGVSNFVLFTLPPVAAGATNSIVFSNSDHVNYEKFVGMATVVHGANATMTDRSGEGTGTSDALNAQSALAASTAPQLVFGYIAIEPVSGSDAPIGTWQAGYAPGRRAINTGAVPCSTFEATAQLVTKQKYQIGMVFQAQENYAYLVAGIRAA